MAWRHMRVTIEVLLGLRNEEYRDSEKMLCNKCPLKREGEAGVRDEMIYESVWGTSLSLEKLQESTHTYT